MITTLCYLLLSVGAPADTLRLPKNLPELPKRPEEQRVDVMPNAKPSLKPNMPVHQHDESRTIPMPNSGTRLHSFQVPQGKEEPLDSIRKKNRP